MKKSSKSDFPNTENNSERLSPNLVSRRWFLYSAGMGMAVLGLQQIGCSVGKQTFPATAMAANYAGSRKGSIEIPVLQWGDSKRPDGTPRHWNPEPVIEMGATLLCVA